ncbi:hypothetical protein B0H19DRAFT_1324862 [Mycena capillaripes]|nr:hypothetical protein B0H19DRAFT_1324862 [Mycena capillaripes]
MSVELDQLETNMHSFQRSFSVNPAALTPGHPYALTSSRRPSTVSFFEFRGIGPPSADLGHPGDVYVDLNPRLHALYWRERDIVRGVGQWKKWTALLLDKVPLHKFLVAHPWARDPESSDLYLWVDPGGVTWTSKENLCASRVQMIQRNIATIVPGTVPDVDSLVSEVLHRMLDAERHATNVPRGAVPNQRAPPSPVPNPGPHSPRAGSSFQTFRPPAAGSTPAHTPYGGTRSQNDSFRSPHPPAGFLPSGSVSFGPPSNTYPNHNNATQEMTEQERYRAAQIALDGMRRAQNAELKSKQELKQKNRELAKRPSVGYFRMNGCSHGIYPVRQKEKEVIGSMMPFCFFYPYSLASVSYHYQKRERELVAALAAAEQRSSAELEEMRAAVHALQRQAEAAQQHTQHAVLTPVAKSADK